MSAAYLNTRVSLFAERLWQDDAFEAFLRAAPEDRVAMLARRGLSPLAAGAVSYAERVVDAPSIEQRIVAQMLDETRVLLRPLAGHARSFLRFWAGRFEISNVKTLLRGKMTGERPAAVLARLTPMGVFARLDNQALAHAEDVGELLRRLGEGPCAGIVRHARRAFEQSQDPFTLDAALDHGYYESLIRHARPLEDEGGSAFRGLMAGLVDRLNLAWLLRYRFNYKLPPAQVYYLLLASPYALTGTRLRELAAGDSLEAVLAALPSPWQARLAGASGIPDVLARMERMAAAQAEHTLRGGAPAIARAFAYLLLRERDLRGIRAVLRGRHLGLADGDIRIALQRDPAGSA